VQRRFHAAPPLACADGDTDTAAACSLLEPDTRLVLADGCADGVCGGTPYVEVVAVWGEPDACTVASLRATCAWGGLSMDFPDCDDDGAADETYLCDMFDQTLTVTGAWDGASAEGLGLGVTATCWEDTLGPMPTQGWSYGDNPWVLVTLAPSEGSVTTIVLNWSFDE
jgi:hypothetical protein